MSTEKLRAEFEEVKSKSKKAMPDIDFEFALYVSFLEKRAAASYWHSCTVILCWALAVMLVIYWR